MHFIKFKLMLRRFAFLQQTLRLDLFVAVCRTLFLCADILRPFFCIRFVTIIWKILF